MLVIDHVLLPVRDLDDAAVDLEARHGLVSVAGGRHSAWGTANRIVPLGEAYLELIAVVDPDVASTSAFGRWVATATSGRPIGWAVRTDDIEEVARRIGQPVVDGTRATPDGTLITWRSTGLDVAVAEPGLPFFLEWGEGVTLPGRARAVHHGGPARLTRLEIPADEVRLAGWLGPHDLPVVATGPSGSSAATVSVGDREVRIG